MGDDGIRLNKFLSGAGICSRREADRLIEEGKVTVDGRTAVPGQKIKMEKQLSVMDGQLRQEQRAPRRNRTGCS